MTADAPGRRRSSSGIAGVTDQIDGYLARRWNVESALGKFADPLADRLMIDAAVILLLHAGRLPWAALLIPLRDLIVLVGTPIVLGRGYEFQVNLIGKAATWLLYLGIGFLMVTHPSTAWPLWIFWAGFALAVHPWVSTRRRHAGKCAEGSRHGRR